MNMPPVVSPQEWAAAREELLVEEKALTRARDALAAKRRRMPRMAVEKDYRFEGPAGELSLLDLFDGRHVHRVLPPSGTRSTIGLRSPAKLIAPRHAATARYHHDRERRAREPNYEGLTAGLSVTLSNL